MNIPDTTPLVKAGYTVAADNTMITVRKVNYRVVASRSLDDLRASRPGLARAWERSGVVAEYVIHRPNGQQVFCVTERKGGTFGKAIMMGYLNEGVQQ